VSTVHFVRPASADDPAQPSGGNAYDRRLAAELRAAGWAVTEVPIGGGWPDPDAATAGELARRLAALPAGSLVLVDGLLAAPAVLAPEGARLRLVLLVHLPRGDEWFPGVRSVVVTSAWSASRLPAGASVHVAVPGCDPAPVAPGSADGGQLLGVGALVPYKGQDVLLDALAGLDDAGWHCTLVGPLDRDRGFVDGLGRRLAATRLAGRVTLTGPLAGAALDGAYAAADLLVLPSRTEAYGMVVTEGLARGVPVVGSAVGGVPEALGEVDGRRPGALVPPGDPAALAAVLRRWLTEPDLRRQWRATARDRREALPSWPATADRVAGVLTQVLNEVAA